MNDITGIGKILPIDKLLEIISSACGRISKAYFDKKDVRTEAYKIEKHAEAEAKGLQTIANAIKGQDHLIGKIKYVGGKIEMNSLKNHIVDIQQPELINPPLEIRSDERLNYQEAKKQLNIESVIAFTAEELIDELPVLDKAIDKDWVTRFFRIVEDVSNDEMQLLWGKILAGEIKQPKSYSLRTLELLRNLSQAEAITFMKVANYAIKEEGKTYTLYTSVNGTTWDINQNKEYSDIEYTDIALLSETGLIQPYSSTIIAMENNSRDSFHVFIIGDIVIIINIKANTETIKMPVVIFTKAGNELINLISPNPSMKYLKSFANSIREKGNVDIKFGKIKTEKGGFTSYSYPLEDL